MAVLKFLAPAAVIVILACGEGGPNSPGPQQLLLATPGGGLPSQQLTQQSLDRNGAAQSLPTDPESNQGALQSGGYVAGYEKVWGTTSDYVTLIALEMGGAPQATSFQSFERSQLESSVNTYVTDHKAIPGSFVFVISGQTRAESNDVICNGVWFVLKQYVFESMVCGKGPSIASKAEDLAMREYQSASAQIS